MHVCQTSSYVGVMSVCYLGRTRSVMSYENPEYHNGDITTWHEPITRSAQGPSVIAQELGSS